jgi:hypothetical protein
VLGNDVFLCPFWRKWRTHFGVEVCDNLVDGVPSCVVAGFYPDSETSGYDSVDDWLACRHSGVVVCRHFVRSDVYSAFDDVKVKHDCFFGGVSCAHSDVRGFGACVGCSRFKS